MVYTAKEAAKLLKVCDRTLKNKLITGEIKGFRVGRQWRVTEEEITKVKEGK